MTQFEIMKYALERIKAKSELWQRVDETTTARAAPPWWNLGDIAAAALQEVAKMESDSERVDLRQEPVKTVMLYLNGSKTAFRCPDCGSNCFHYLEKGPVKVRFACNGCGTEYSAELDKEDEC